jgi:hypothetical protein
MVRSEEPPANDPSLYVPDERLVVWTFVVDSEYTRRPVISGLRSPKPI